MNDSPASIAAWLARSFHADAQVLWQDDTNAAVRLCWSENKFAAEVELKFDDGVWFIDGGWFPDAGVMQRKLLEAK